MEVDFRISRPLVDLSSPGAVADAIGVPIGARILFRREEAAIGCSEATRMTVRCDNLAASRLRRRFDRSRPYSHSGLLTSIKCVAVRPIALCDVKTITPHTTHTTSVKVLPRRRSYGASISTSESSCDLRFRPSLTAPTVEEALAFVEDEEAVGLHVPGIADLHYNFLRCAASRTPYPGGSVAGDHARKHSYRQTQEEKEGGEARRDQGERKRSIEVSEEETKRCSSPGTVAQYSRSGSGWNGARQDFPDMCRTPQVDRLQRGQRRVVTAQRSIDAHQRKWHRRYRRARHASVESVASAFAYITRRYPDAPGRVDLSTIISLLKRFYTEGTAFLSNRPRDMETLDYLGVARWCARKNHSVTPQGACHTPSSESPSSAPGQTLRGWRTLLRKVKGIVRKFVDFGTFVQLYAIMAAHVNISPAIPTIEECRKKREDRGDTTNRIYHHHRRCLGAIEANSKEDRKQGGRDIVNNIEDLLSSNFPGRQGYGETKALSSWSLHYDKAERSTSEERRVAREGGQTKTRDELKWLFASNDGCSSRTAFDRHVVCGGLVHGLIPIEAIATIIREAGKDIATNRVMRWWCEKRRHNDHPRHQHDHAGEISMAVGARAAFSPWRKRGCFVCFSEFVELCTALREHMVDTVLSCREDNETCDVV